MKRKINGFHLLLVAVTISFIVSGCMTSAKKKCLNGDWKAIGLSEGKKGYQLDRIEEHNRDCKVYDTSVNVQEYELGWWQGIYKYCVPSNGYTLGTAMKPYHEACIGNLEEGFLLGYREGLETTLRNIFWKYRQIKKDYILSQEKIEQTTNKKKQKALEKKMSAQKKGLEGLEETIKEIKRLQAEARERGLTSGF